MEVVKLGEVVSTEASCDEVPNDDCSLFEGAANEADEINVAEAQTAEQRMNE